MHQCRCNVLFMFRSISRKKSHLEISVSCTSQTYDNVTKPCYPSFRSMIRYVVAYGKLKTKQNFKLWVLKVIAVACKRWLLTRDSNSDLMKKKVLLFTKSSKLARMSLSRSFSLKSHILLWLWEHFIPTLLYYVMSVMSREWEDKHTCPLYIVFLQWARTSAY